MFHLFKRRGADDLKRELLHEAEVEAVLHQASAAHHQALAGMYAARVEQLRSELDSQPRTPAEALIDTNAPGLQRPTNLVVEAMINNMRRFNSAVRQW